MSSFVKYFVPIGLIIASAYLMLVASADRSDQVFERADCIVQVSLSFPSNWTSSDSEDFKERVTEVLWDPSLVGLDSVGQNLAAVRFNGDVAESDLVMYLQFRRACEEKLHFSNKILSGLLEINNDEIRREISETKIYPGIDTIEHCSDAWVDCL